MNRVDGRVAMVTGAAQGIGAATAKLLAEAGARVIVSDVRGDLGESVVAEILAAGGTANFAHHDVSSEDDWAHAVDDAVRHYGKLDIVVNNAAIWWLNDTETTT